MRTKVVGERMDHRSKILQDIILHFRKNHQRALDSMQASLEAEARGKAESLRMKKKLEADINELEVALDGANRSRADAEQNTKRYQVQIRELQAALEEEQHGRDEAREQFQASVIWLEDCKLRTQNNYRTLKTSSWRRFGM